MCRYSSPACTTASGRLNGSGSIPSRMSITTLHPAPFSVARCSRVGCPPVTIPGIGSEALGTPAMAWRSWLMGNTVASFRSTNLAHADRYGSVSPPPPPPPPRHVPTRPSGTAPQALAQLGRGVPHGAALSTVPRRGRPPGHHPGCRWRGGVELSDLPQSHPRDGARPRRQGAGHDPWRREPRGIPTHAGGPPARAAVREVAARSVAPERRRISEDFAPIGTR